MVGYFRSERFQAWSLSGCELISTPLPLQKGRSLLTQCYFNAASRYKKVSACIHCFLCEVLPTCVCVCIAYSICVLRKCNLAQVHLHLMQISSSELGTQRNRAQVQVAITNIIYELLNVNMVFCTWNILIF